MRTSYEERVPVLADELRRLGRPATVAELFDKLRRDHRFETSRRIAATFRYDQDPKRRRYAEPVFIREGKERIALRSSSEDATSNYPLDESRVYERGQTVVPKVIREAAAIDYGTRLHWEVHEGVIHVIPMPKDPIAAARGILKGKGPTFKEFIADRNRERARERELEEEERKRWRSSSIRPRS